MSNKQEGVDRNQARSSPAQLDRFKQTARELGCDETGEAFERVFAKAAPAKRPKKTARSDQP